MATLDEMAGKGFKQNRNVGYEKPPKSFSREKVEEKSTTLIDQPGNTRDYHYPSGGGDVSPIRNQSKHVVGSRKERMRDMLEISQHQKVLIEKKYGRMVIPDEVATATGERRDFSRQYNSDKYMIGSIKNAGNPQKEDGRFIRPVNRLNNQKLGGIEKSVTDGKREYHGEPCGKVEPIGKESIDGKRGYHYPSGEGEKSPIVGKVISTKNGRR